MKKPTNIYLDCEFDGMHGDLISMAFAAEDGREMYVVVPIDHTPNKWVVKNVMPILGKDATSVSDLFSKTMAFLGMYDAVNIISDHPADIVYLCKLMMIDDSGAWMSVPPISFQIIPHVNYKSLIPHNALEDARALRLALMPKERPVVPVITPLIKEMG